MPIVSTSHDCFCGDFNCTSCCDKLIVGLAFGTHFKVVASFAVNSCRVLYDYTSCSKSSEPVGASAETFRIKHEHIIIANKKLIHLLVTIVKISLSVFYFSTIALKSFRLLYSIRDKSNHISYTCLPLEKIML